MGVGSPMMILVPVLRILSTSALWVHASRRAVASLRHLATYLLGGYFAQPRVVHLTQCQNLIWSQSQSWSQSRTLRFRIPGSTDQTMFLVGQKTQRILRRSIRRALHRHI